MSRRTKEYSQAISALDQKQRAEFMLSLRGAVYLWHSAATWLARSMKDLPGAEYQGAGMLFIVAVRNVYRAGRAAQTVATDEQKPMIDAALRQFDALTGDAKEMRDMFEHFDAYLLGVGDRQRSHKLKYIHFYVRGKKNEVRLSDLAVDVKLALDATDAVAAAVILDKP